MTRAEVIGDPMRRRVTLRLPMRGNEPGFWVILTISEAEAHDLRDQLVDIFGERRPVPPEPEYVVTEKPHVGYVVGGRS